MSSEGGADDSPRPGGYLNRRGAAVLLDRLRARLGPRRTSWAIAVTLAVATLGALAVLRVATPEPSPEPRAQPTPTRTRRTPTTPTVSPTTPPRGPLPTPEVVNEAGNRISGKLLAPKPSEQSALFGVGTILEHYCPTADLPRVEMHRRGDAYSFEAVVEPHPGYSFRLRLSWNGENYQWEGPFDALDLCW